MSLQNYRLPEYPAAGDDEREQEEEEQEEEQERTFVRGKTTGINSGRGNGNGGCGKKGPRKAPKVTGPGSEKKEIITKHDLEKDSLKNARRMERVSVFPFGLFIVYGFLLTHLPVFLVRSQLPAIAVGNPAKVKDLRLPYKVFNSLKNHASKAAAWENKRNKTRLFDKEDYSTQDSVLDKRTRLLLLQLINKEILDEIDGIISTGKEANVYYATAIDNWEDDEEQAATETKKKQGKTITKKARPAPLEDDEEDHVSGNEDDEDAEVEYDVVECAVKIFKTSLQEFKNREDYIRDDSRYVNRLSKHNPRKLIKLWAEKEMLNLRKMQRAGIPCPDVIHHEGHILLLSFIGKEKKAAPTLKEAGRLLSLSRREDLYDQCVQGMKALYQRAHLVHADLSEYNMLYHEQKLWFIDVSQAVEREHPNAHVFLYRDCCNVTRFFRSIGVDHAMSELELFTFVTSEDLTQDSLGDEGLAQQLASFVHSRLGTEVSVSFRDPFLTEILDKLLPTYMNERLLEDLEAFGSSTASGESTPPEEGSDSE